MVAHWATGDWIVTSCAVAPYGFDMKAKDGGESVMFKKLCSKVVFKYFNRNYRGKNLDTQTVTDSKRSCVFPIIKYANQC